MLLAAGARPRYDGCNTSSEGAEDGAWPRPRRAFPHDA